MMSGDSIRALVRRYAVAWEQNDREGWLATFASTATQEDPIGAGVRRGRDEIGGFWDLAMESRDSLQILPRAIHVAGGEAAMEWTIVARNGQQRTTFDGVDVFTFTPAPLIASVRAYWDRSTFRLSDAPS